MPTISYHVRTGQAQVALAQLENRMMMTSGAIASGSRIADTALMAVSAAFIAMGAGAFVAYNAVSQFQESLTTVRALGGVTKVQMYELAASINEVAAQFGVSGDEIAEGAVMLSKAGLTVDQINESIASMTALSKANGLAFEEAARMTVFAVNTFGKEFSEATQLMDAMQVATQESILDIGDLQKAFAFAGSTAVMSGVSFEQLVSIMAVLSNRALEAGISARSVNKMFLDMILNTDELQEWMTSMGMTFEIIRDGKLDIDALMDAFSGQQLTLEMLQSASDIFTVRALRSFGLLIGAADDYQVMLSDVTNSQGALAEVVAIQMESFTAMFGRLRQELLAPLRSPEVIEQVSKMVDGFIEMFNVLKPELINSVVLGLIGFTDVITNDTFLNGVRLFADGLFTVFQGLNFINRLATGNALVGWFLKLAVVWKLAQLTMIPFTLMMERGTQSLIQNSIARNQNIMAIREQGLAILNNSMALLANGEVAKLSNMMAELEILQWKRKQLAVQGFGQKVAMASSALLGLMGIGMMIGAADSPLMITLFSIMAVATALNSTLMIMGALESASMSGPGFIPVFLGSLALMAATALAFRASRAEQMKDLNQVAVYDSGGISTRHQLAYLEPGETVIPKSQNMLGGGGVTVNVGDVYAQDGTDFANKLADALPYALRQVSDRGGI